MDEEEIHQPTFPRHHRLTLDLWLAKDNRFLNPKSSYKRILMAGKKPGAGEERNTSNIVYCKL